MQATHKHQPFLYVMLKLILWKIEIYEKANSKKISAIGTVTFEHKLNDIGTTITNRKLFFICNASDKKERLFHVFDNFYFDQYGLYEKDIPQTLKYGGIRFDYDKIDLGRNNLISMKGTINTLRLSISRVSPNFCAGIDKGIDHLKKYHPEFITDSLQKVVAKYSDVFMLRQYKLLFDKKKEGVSVETSILKSISTTYSPAKSGEDALRENPPFDTTSSSMMPRSISKKDKTPTKEIKSNISPSAKSPNLTDLEEFKKRIERKNPKK